MMMMMMMMTTITPTATVMAMIWSLAQEQALMFFEFTRWALTLAFHVIRINQVNSGLELLQREIKMKAYAATVEK
jgi:hypothetical protein